MCHHVFVAHVFVCSSKQPVVEYLWTDDILFSFLLAAMQRQLSSCCGIFDVGHTLAMVHDSDNG